MSKKIFFVSDFHLGSACDLNDKREKRIVDWLESIKNEAEEILFVGDIFDYWFEYKEVIPKGYLRFQACLKHLSESGIKMSFFTGNHDMWMFDYFPNNFGIEIIRHPILRKINGKNFFIGHGDGLGPGDHSYKLIKKIFSNSICQWLFARLHPNFGLRLMRFLSRKSREKSQDEGGFIGPDGEWLIQFANDKIKDEPIDFFIFGHRHLVIDHTLSNGSSRYINLGDWIRYNSYAVWDGQELNIKFYKDEKHQIHG